MPFIKTSRGEFFYLKYGLTGPVVYLLHGLGAKCQDWESIPDELAEAGFRVFAFDMKGHGQSEKPKSGYAPEDLARDLEACAGELSHHDIHVVGHSTGGRNALFFATMFVEKTASLTIIDQTLTADLERWKKTQDEYSQYPVPFTDEASLDRYLHNKYPDNERWIKFEKRQFSLNAANQWDWNFSVPAVLEIQRLGRAKALHWLLKRVQCPTLFIKAEESSYLSQEECEKIIDLLPPESLKVIEKVGHGVFRDNPRAFLDILVPFLQSISAS
jgi:pimeloyl-ACP methyl ester carboxylesterase